MTTTEQQDLQNSEGKGLEQNHEVVLNTSMLYSVNFILPKNLSASLQTEKFKKIRT